IHRSGAGTATIINSTLSGNEAGGGGSGSNGGPGGDGGDGGAGGGPGSVFNGFGLRPLEDGGSPQSGAPDSMTQAAPVGEGGDGGDGVTSGGDGGDAASPVVSLTAIGGQRGDGGDGGDGADAGDGGDGGDSGTGAALHSAGSTVLVHVTAASGGARSPGLGGNVGSGGSGGSSGTGGSAIDGAAGLSGSATLTAGSGGVGSAGPDGADGTTSFGGIGEFDVDIFGPSGSAGSAGADATNAGADGSDGSLDAALIVGTVEAEASVIGFGSDAACAQPLVSNGDNAASDATCGLGGSDVGVLAGGIGTHLGALADNGGPTETHLPVAGSPIVNAIPVDCSVDADQRGVARGQDAACEVGAVELTAPFTFTVSKTAAPTEVEIGDTITYTITVTNTSGGVVALDEVVVTDPLCTLTQVSAGDGDDLFEPDEALVLTCDVVAAAEGTLTNTVTVDVDIPLAGPVQLTDAVDVTVLGANEEAPPTTGGPGPGGRALPTTGGDPFPATHAGLALIGFGLLLLLAVHLRRDPATGAARHLRRR
ncbi:MAG: choice-of-anchor Q domain-containing protein, partial [Acidimicrobiales bacterium]